MIPGYVLGDLSLGRDTTMTSRSTRRTVAALGIAAAVTGTTLVATPSAHAAGQITVALRDGVLYVAGNDSANVVRLHRATDGRILVTADSRIVRRGATPRVGNVTSIRISVRGGNDTVRLFEGLPKATVFGDAGDDKLVGGTAAETLRGGAGNDWILGGGGADLLMGEADNDNLDGQAGNDRLVAGAGDDSLLGAAGDDILRGEVGDDAYYFDQEVHPGSDTVREFAGQGTDEVYFWGQTGVTFSLASAAPQAVNGSLTIQLEAADTFEDLHGGHGADVLTGNALANRINGGEGNDQLTGGAGADAFVPGDNWAEWMDDQLWRGDFGSETITDFADEDTVDLYSDKEVTSGLGTSTVTITSTNEDGSMTATGHTFDVEDFS